MNLAQANEIFRSEYPEGEIWKERSGFGVSFSRASKGYHYNAESIPALLTRFGFNVMTPNVAETMRQEIKRMEREITEGGRKSVFAKGGFAAMTAERKAAYETRISRYREQLAAAIIG